MTGTPNPYLLLLEVALHRIAAQLPPGWPVTAEAVTIQVNGTALRLVVGPPGAEVPAAESAKMTARHRKVLEAVQVEIDRLGRRVLGREILEALHAAGYRLGRSTLNETLADLVHGGRLVNDNDRRGYALPGQDG